MHILLSNDDGFYARGIKHLYQKLKQNHQISIAAPDRNCSGASSSLSLDKPVKIRKIANNQFCIEGTPADCVHIALTGLISPLPDMVISGINYGSNLGDDTIYSGTVAAAIEGRHLGIASIAISLCIEPNDKEFYFDTACQCVDFILTKMLQNNQILSTLIKLDRTRSIFNINIPNVAYQDIQGFQITRLGFREKAQDVVKTKNPRGKDIFWIGAAGKSADNAKGTDFYAIENNYVSITPIHTDLTAHHEIEHLKKVFS